MIELNFILTNLIGNAQNNRIMESMSQTKTCLSKQSGRIDKEDEEERSVVESTTQNFYKLDDHIEAKNKDEL